MSNKNFIVDHDCGVADLAALTMIALGDLVSLKLVTIAPAVSFKRTAYISTRGLLNFLGGENITLAISDLEGLNKFPDIWRSDSDRLAKFDEFSIQSDVTDASMIDAVDALVQEISSGLTYQIVATGPLSNIAAALQREPKIKNNIERIFVMGGAVRVRGNVAVEGHDGSAEWNFFNNPSAAKTVLESGIPITMIPLDATNHVPITKSFMTRLAAQSQFRLSKLFYKAWNIVADQMESGVYEEDYYFWDTLTAAAALQPDLVDFNTLNLEIVEFGSSQGRVIESENGIPVQVALTANAKLFEDWILENLKK